jgi:hypothetical protein
VSVEDEKELNFSFLLAVSLCNLPDIVLFHFIRVLTQKAKLSGGRSQSWIQSGLYKEIGAEFFLPLPFSSTICCPIYFNTFGLGKETFLTLQRPGSSKAGSTPTRIPHIPPQCECDFLSNP